MPRPIVDVIIPAFNEAQSVGLVVADLPHGMLRHIVVVDNNSTDYTANVALKAGATVLHQPEQGYGAACLMGLDFLRKQPQHPDVVVFLDADYSDHPEELPLLLAPIALGEAQLVIGARHKAGREKGAMMPQQIFGNRLASVMMKAMYNGPFTDLGPFRAITWHALEKIGMADRNYGWTAEMQVKALKMKIPVVEVPVKYRRRRGKSKVSGTIRGTLLAGYKIILTILRYA